ncbi:alpha/beta hydrolase [Georgenia yuyongxinii]|uniref:Alpha/beta hydrolase n=1 Tax=Georgenia yuyongxinii TaxID=2589797 RepID=A0A5B8C2R2_9MICO|nr:alpha/beta hydrolase [Georgenia yuyongxinii]QDC23515.1 alpha/beta hydrolase [Georgenia yuyongxinii]
MSVLDPARPGPAALPATDVLPGSRPAPPSRADLSTLAAPEDLLGPPWVARTILLAERTDGGEDPAAPDVATLVHQEHAGGRERAVLYLSGFVDYFFQTDHAQAWIDAGYDFYALDLRRAGRSINNHPRPNDVRDLRVHDEEIGLALDLIRGAGARQVVLLGHSTGGLQAVLWAADHPGSIDALVLNSPWLDLNRGWFERTVLTAAVNLLGRWLPSLKVGTIGEVYGRHLHSATGGEWEYDLALKPHAGFPARAGFSRSVRRAHAEVARGLDVEVPVLLCCSTRSGDRRNPGPAELSSTDVVLDVRQMIERAPMIGPDVTIMEVPGGVHDLALSPGTAREYHSRGAVEWAGARLSEQDEAAAAG